MHESYYFSTPLYKLNKSDVSQQLINLSMTLQKIESTVRMKFVIQNSTFFRQ